MEQDPVRRASRIGQRLPKRGHGAQVDRPARDVTAYIIECGLLFVLNEARETILRAIEAIEFVTPGARAVPNIHDFSVAA